MVCGETRSPARLCCRDGKSSYYGRLEYDFLVFVFFCALLPALSTIFSLFSCLASYFFSHFLIPYPGMVTVSCSRSFVCAVPGAAICQLSGGECTINISSVNCKQQVQKSKTNTRTLLGVVLVPVAAIYQLSGGGGVYYKYIKCKLYQVNKYTNKKKLSPNTCIINNICSQVPGTKGTYAFICSYRVPGAAIYQLSGGGCTINNCQQVQKSKKNRQQTKHQQIYAPRHQVRHTYQYVTKGTYAFIY